MSRSRTSTQLTIRLQLRFYRRRLHIAYTGSLKSMRYFYVFALENVPNILERSFEFLKYRSIIYIILSSSKVKFERRIT